MTAAGRPEHGSTLIEVLISVVILGLAITAFLLGMTTTVSSSGLSRAQATGETLLISAGEAVRDSNVNPYKCGDLSTAQQQYKLVVPGAAQPPPGWAAAVKITNVQYWDPLGGAWKDITAPGFIACPAGNVPPYLQGLTITVTSPDGGVSLSRTYVKAPPP